MSCGAACVLQAQQVARVSSPAHFVKATVAAQVTLLATEIFVKDFTLGIRLPLHDSQL